MSTYTLCAEETTKLESKNREPHKHLTTWSFTDKEKALDEAYQLFKSIFYRLNPYGNDPDCVDKDGERLMFVIKSSNGSYFLKTKMNGEIQIKIWVK